MFIKLKFSDARPPSEQFYSREDILDIEMDTEEENTKSGINSTDELLNMGSRPQSSLLNRSFYDLDSGLVMSAVGTSDRHSQESCESSASFTLQSDGILVPF